MSLAFQITAFNNKMEESNPYYDYAFKWFDFTSKYNSVLFEAAANAFETFLSTREGTAHDMEKTIRSSFDTTLRDNLNDDALSSSMTDYVDSWLNLVSLSDYKEFTKNFHNFLSYANQMLEPLRDSINRTPSEASR